MEINYIIYPFILISAALFGQAGNTPKNRKNFIILILAVLILEVVLRSLSVGSDTHKYYELFHTYSAMPWSDVLEQFIIRYTVGGNDDIGYILLIKVIGSLTNSWFVYTFLTSLLFFIPFGILLYRYTDDFLQLSLAFLLYVTLFHIIALCGGRQLFAMGFGIMSFMYLDQKKYFKAIIVILIGSLIHLSLLLCLLPIAMSRLKPVVLKAVHVVSFLLIPLVLMNVNRIIYFMGEVAQNERYMKYGQSEVVGGGITFILLLELCSILFFIAFNKKQLSESRSLRLLYSMVPLFTFFGPTIYSSGSMIRISMYFHLYMVLLMPYSLDTLFRKDRQSVYILVIVLLVYLGLTMSGRVHYYFFWQEPELFQLYYS